MHYCVNSMVWMYKTCVEPISTHKTIFVINIYRFKDRKKSKKKHMSIIKMYIGSYKFNFFMFPDRLSVNPDQGPWMMSIRSLLPIYTRLLTVFIEI